MKVIIMIVFETGSHYVGWAALRLGSLSLLHTGVLVHTTKLSQVQLVHIKGHH